MQVIYNSLTGKDTTNSYTCDKCGSIISVSKGEMFTGYLGNKYFKCPVCGKYTMAEQTEDYQKIKDIVYPYSFYNYVKDFTTLQATDKDINAMIKDVFRDGLEPMKMNMVQYGDAMVLAIEHDVSDDKPSYELYVCKCLDTTTCTEG